MVCRGARLNCLRDLRHDALPPTTPGLVSATWQSNSVGAALRILSVDVERRYDSAISSGRRYQYCQHRYSRINNDGGSAGRTGREREEQIALFTNSDSCDDSDRLGSDGYTRA